MDWANLPYLPNIPQREIVWEKKREIFGVFGDNQFPHFYLHLTNPLPVSTQNRSITWGRRRLGAAYNACMPFLKNGARALA